MSRLSPSPQRGPAACRLPDRSNPAMVPRTLIDFACTLKIVKYIHNGIGMILAAELYELFKFYYPGNI